MARRGFTLIEILMVVAIIGLVAAFAIPKLNLRGYRTNAAVRGLANAMLRAQRRAVTTQANVNVMFDVAKNRFTIHEDDNNNNVQDPGEVVRSYPVGEGVVFGLGGAPVRTYAAPVSFTRRQNGLPEVIFRRDGSASENGGFYITTQGTARSSDARDLEIQRATGRPSWFQYNGSTWTKRF